MRRCSGRQAFGLVPRPQIAADLQGLGLRPGDTVMLHAAVGAIGWIVGGPAEVLHGVFDVLGAAGTLLMYVGWDGSPYDVTIDLEELPPQLAALWPAYDPETSNAVRSWGVLGEILRRWPGAARSGHPDSSFAAVGSRAAELVADHALQYGMGEDSPLAKLCAANGKVLLLGSPLSNVTLLHHAEHLAQVPEKATVRYWAPILRAGEKAWVRIEEFNTGGEGCLPWFGADDMFEALMKDHIQDGHGEVGSVGAAQSHLFEAADLVAFAVEWIEERFALPIDREIEIEVVRAEPDDHPEVCSLFGLMEEETPGAIAPRSRLSTRVDEFLEDRDRGVFVARAGGHSVGVIVATSQGSDRGILEQAFVDPAYRRRGILRELEIDAAGFLMDQGCRAIQVHVDADNEVARAAWRALGYEPSEEFLERAV